MFTKQKIRDNQNIAAVLDYIGPVARELGGDDVAMLIGLPTSAALYSVACRSMDLTQEFPFAAAADEGLEASVNIRK